MIKFLNNLFKKKSSKNIKISGKKYSYSDKIDEEISFTDLNQSTIKIKIRTLNNENLFFITNKEETLMYVFDRDTAVILNALFSDFIENGNISNIHKIIGESRNGK